MTTQDLVNTLRQGKPMTAALVREIVRELEELVALREACEPLIAAVTALDASGLTLKVQGADMDAICKIMEEKP